MFSRIFYTILSCSLLTSGTIQNNPSKNSAVNNDQHDTYYKKGYELGEKRADALHAMTVSKNSAAIQTFMKACDHTEPEVLVLIDIMEQERTSKTEKDNAFNKYQSLLKGMQKAYTEVISAEDYRIARKKIAARILIEQAHYLSYEIFQTLLNSSNWHEANLSKIAVLKKRISEEPMKYKLTDLKKSRTFVVDEESLQNSYYLAGADKFRGKLDITKESKMLEQIDQHFIKAPSCPEYKKAWKNLQLYIAGYMKENEDWIMKSEKRSDQITSKFKFSQALRYADFVIQSILCE